MDSTHIVCMDMDRFELFWLEEEVKYLQNTFKIGEAYIFESSPEKYHVIIPDKLTYLEVVTILKNSSVDPNYVSVPSHFGKPIFNIRITDKKGNPPIRFLKKLPSIHTTRIKSMGHILLLNKLYNLEIPTINTDEETRVTLVRYPI